MHATTVPAIREFLAGHQRWILPWDDCHPAWHQPPVAFPFPVGEYQDWQPILRSLPTSQMVVAAAVSAQLAHELIVRHFEVPPGERLRAMTEDLVRAINDWRRGVNTPSAATIETAAGLTTYFGLRAFLNRKSC